MAAITPMMALQAAGAIFGAIQSAKAAKQNARIEDMNAGAAGAERDEAVRIKTEDRQKLLSKQSAKYAASGVLLNEGAPLDVLTEQFFNLTRDIQNTRLTGDVKVSSAEGRAALQRSKASQALTGGVIKAGSTLLGGTIAGNKPIFGNKNSSDVFMRGGAPF